MEKLSMSERSESNFTLYELRGAFTFYTIDAVRSVLYKKISRSNVVLDLSQVSEIDSAGPGLLLAVFSDALNAEHILYMLNPSENVLRSLEKTGLFDLLSVIASVNEAV